MDNAEYTDVNIPRYYGNEPVRGTDNHPLGYDISNNKEGINKEKQNSAGYEESTGRRKLKHRDPYDTKRIEKYEITKIYDLKHERPLPVSPIIRKGGYYS